MGYGTTEARLDMLREIAGAIDRIAAALGALGAAYELLDERTADTLEEQLFRPAQVAYGRAKRTHEAFAARYGLPGRAFAPGAPGAARATPHELLETAEGAIAEADDRLAELQDSLRPVEVGDPELRAGLAEVRTLLGVLPGRAHQLGRLVGR